MGSLCADDQMDEVHCLWALCPHPCCWEAERRIAKGIYRHAVRAPAPKHGTNPEETLPSLTLVDVSDWTGTKTVSPSRTSLTGRIPPPRRDATPRLKTTNPSFPAITLAAAKSHARGSSTRDMGDNTAHISPLIGSPWGSESLVLWVPNPHYVPQCLKSSKSPQCAVKELICLPTSQTLSTSKVNRKRSTKSVRFHLTCSPLTFHASRQTESVSPDELEAGTGDSLQGSAVVDDPEHLRHLSAFLVKNKPAVFHSVRERRVSRASRDAPASLYKLDTKTGEEDLDWDRLRGQSYLWKRHNVHHVSPPGGARGAEGTVGSSPVSKPSTDRTLHSPQCAAPAAWPCVKKTLCSSRYTHPLLSHKRHPPRTGSELDMTICSTSAVTEHNRLHRMLDMDAPLNSRVLQPGLHTPAVRWDAWRGQRAREISNPCPDTSRDIRIISGAMEPWGRRSSTIQLCTSIPSLS